MTNIFFSSAVKIYTFLNFLLKKYYFWNLSAAALERMMPTGRKLNPLTWTPHDLDNFQGSKRETIAKHDNFYCFTFRMAKSNLEHNGCIAEVKVWIGALPALFWADRFEGTIVVMKGVKMAIMTDMRDRTMCWGLPHSLVGQHTAHWTMHSVQCTLNTACCTLNAAHCTLYTAHYTPHTTHWKIYSGHLKMHHAHFKIQTEHGTLHSAHC